SSVDFVYDITSTSLLSSTSSCQSVCFLFILNSSVDFVYDITSTSLLSSTSPCQSVCFLFILNSSVDFVYDITSTSLLSSLTLIHQCVSFTFGLVYFKIKDNVLLRRLFLCQIS